MNTTYTSPYPAGIEPAPAHPAWRWIRRLLLAAVLLVLALGTGAVLTWEPDRQLGALAAHWAPPPSRFVDVDGMQVHVRDVGPRDDPQPIVLLHGLSASLHTWEGWVDGLSSNRRVITVDLPGFGLTGPSIDGDYRIEAYVRFVLRLMDTLGVQRVVLGGNALGGEIAWRTALTAPKRVSALVLVDSNGYELSALSVPIAFRLVATPAMEWFTTRILPRFIVDYSVRNVYGHPEQVTPALVDRYFELALRVGNRAALRRRFAQTEHGEQAARIKDIRQPTLILWGARDRLVPPEHAQRFQRDIAGSELYIFDDLGHVPQEESAARTLQPVKDFLAALH